MRAVVTGAAGFIGSHLCEHLLAAGDEVIGVDCLTDTYDPAVKRRNLRTALGSPASPSVMPTCCAPRGRAPRRCRRRLPLGRPARGTALLGRDFALYTDRNVLATQRLLEAARAQPPAKFVYASSSSVYGEATLRPTPESAHPRPVSPYGVTKLAGEQLCELYRTARAAHRRAAAVHRLRAPAAARHGLRPAARRRDPAGPAFPLYGDGGPDPRLHLRHRRGVRDARRRPRLFTGIANLGGAGPVSINRRSPSSSTSSARYC